MKLGLLAQSFGLGADKDHKYWMGSIRFIQNVARSDR